MHVHESKNLTSLSSTLDLLANKMDSVFTGLSIPASTVDNPEFLFCEQHGIAYSTFGY